MADNNNMQQEEVDLGKLFQLIGKGFGNFFKFIGNFFKSILHYIILTLIFLRKNIIVIGGATVLGFISGYLLEMDKPIEYTSNMIVETNYGSGHRLYKQIDFLNTLISEKDSIKLGEIFKIKPTKASKLNSFIVEPYDKDKSLVKEFDSYLKSTDTIFTRGFTVENFKERMNDADFKKQTIIAFSSNKKIFNNLKDGLISLVKNDYFNKRHQAKQTELIKQKLIIEKDLKVIDSLRILYKNVAILNATNNTTPNTNIDLGGKQSTTNKDIELFNQNTSLVIKLSEVNRELVNSDFIIDTVSDFNDGEIYNSIESLKWFRYGVLGFILSLFTILALRLNTYLINYNK